MRSIQNIAIIPEPVKINISTGKFILTDNAKILTDKNLLNISEFLKNLIFPATGINLKIKEFDEITVINENSINLQLIEDENKIGSEGYILSITPKNINVSAKTPAGIFYGIQTIRQLLPAEIESNKIIDNIEWEIPCLEVVDFPRFSWRGYMLDEARYFYGKDVVKRLLDLMALFKMNIFHWHLTDDQGWRIEIKKYPKLTEIGSKREESQIGGYFSKKKDRIPHSGYYSQKDIQEIVIYAKKRFITIIPEIDMPGHTRAALASYPNLSCKGYPFKVSTQWGIHKNILCVGKEEVFEFAQDVLNEIIDLFPSRIIHIGGDEVPKNRWKECTHCQSRINNEGLNSEKDLQVYFTNRITTFLHSKGKRVMGWNEILGEKLKGDVICQYWLRGKKKVLEHLQKGRKAIMSNFKYAYLDHSYSFTPLKLAYNFEPIPKKLQKQYHKNILGIESLMWGEFIPNIKRLEWQTFPRLIAFSEVGWTLKNKENYNSFQNRLDIFLKRFDLLGINYAKRKEVKPGFFKKKAGIFTLAQTQNGGNSS